MSVVLLLLRRRGGCDGGVPAERVVSTPPQKMDFAARIISSDRKKVSRVFELRDMIDEEDRRKGEDNGTDLNLHQEEKETSKQRGC